MNRYPIAILLCGLMLFVASSCNKEDELDEQEPEQSASEAGSADVVFSGELNSTLGDYASWEITEDPLLRIRLGSEFPSNIVINYRLESNKLSDLKTGTYEAVSGTFTGQPNDEMAFQYNGEESHFPDSGTISIDAVSETLIEGSINVEMSPANGETTQVNGTFKAAPL